VAFIDTKNATKIWMMNEKTARAISLRNSLSTKPYIDCLDQAIGDMKNAQLRDDYEYGGMHSGLKWLTILKRTEDFWRPNLSTKYESIF
jgi:hypothetical protein